MAKTNPPTNAPTTLAPVATDSPISSSGVSDQQRISFLEANAGNLNNAVLVPLTDPRVIPLNRKRTAQEGCAEAVDGFICADLGRFIRCVGGAVAINVVAPFSANHNLKACVGGFCGGTVAGTSPGGNKCVQTATQAVQGSDNGNEFFLPPPPPAGVNINGVPAADGTNWEQGFTGTVALGLQVVPNAQTNTGAIAGGVIAGLGFVGAAAFVVMRRSKASSQQLTSSNPAFQTEHQRNDNYIVTNSAYVNSQMQQNQPQAQLYQGQQYPAQAAYQQNNFYV